MEWRNKAVKHQIWGWDFCNDRFTMHLLYLSMTNTFPPWQLGYLLKREALSCFFIHTCRQIKHVELKHAKEILLVHTIGLIFVSKSGEYSPILPDLHQRKYNVSNAQTRMIVLITRDEECIVLRVLYCETRHCDYMEEGQPSWLV